MSTKPYSTFYVCPNIVLKGDLKVGADVEFSTDYKGKLRSTGQVRIRAGVSLESDVTCDSFWLEPGASFKGNLQVGDARKPLGRMWSWFNKLGNR